MKPKRWTLKISFVGSRRWDIKEDFRQLSVCQREANELKDETVKLMVIKDNVTNKEVSI